MKRLTIRNGDRKVELKRMNAFTLLQALQKLARLEDAEEDGRLIVLPKKPQEIDLRRAAELLLADEMGRVEIRDEPHSGGRETSSALRAPSPEGTAEGGAQA